MTTITDFILTMGVMTLYMAAAAIALILAGCIAYIGYCIVSYRRHRTYLTRAGR